MFHEKEAAINKLYELNVNIEEDILDEALEYLEYRANLLNNSEKYLMNAEEAKEIFLKYNQLHTDNNFTCDLPMNKQKHEKQIMRSLRAL